MTQQPIEHGTFTIERTYAASPAKVFSAWSDIEIKARWFIGPEGWTQTRREQKFEVGGREILEGRFSSGLVTRYAAQFFEIVRNARIVYVYDMYVGDRHHSLSLSTVEVAPVEGGSRFVYTEQTAFLDGTNGAEGTESRRRGVGGHLDGLGTLLRETG